MKYSYLIGIFFLGFPSFASKCVAPGKVWLNPSLKPEAAHFEFTFAWESPENAKAQIQFRDGKTGKSVVAVSANGVFIQGKKACGFSSYSLSGCPADLPLKVEDENLFQVEFSGMQNQKLTMPFRGQKLEVNFPDGLECRLVSAEATQKELITQTLQNQNLASFLSAALTCVTGKNKTCRPRYFAPDVVEQLQSANNEDLAPLVFLLKQKAYPRVLHVTEEAPGEVCTEAKPNPSRVQIIGDNCELVSLNRENSSWRITQYSGG